mmetsp:Transcript_25610/g.65928  ORF Transcript_25610/g.65928 Transcript_25610/m.65928 type:complete len:220 (+) Transcript_25610:1662-2321(+)
MARSPLTSPPACSAPARCTTTTSPCTCGCATPASRTWSTCRCTRARRRASARQACTSTWTLMTAAARRACTSTRRTACTARHATSRTPRRTSIGLRPRAAAARRTEPCEPSEPRNPAVFGCDEACRADEAMPDAVVMQAVRGLQAAVLRVKYVGSSSGGKCQGMGPCIHATVSHRLRDARHVIERGQPLIALIPATAVDSLQSLLRRLALIPAICNSLC